MTIDQSNNDQDLISETGLIKYDYMVDNFAMSPSQLHNKENRLMFIRGEYCKNNCYEP